ncbi:MAG: hypothetical protein J7J61_10435 [Candidatus Hydrothermae bacterium]|nr:hypothetical protein [Candidatus Hydrothermae bacterium]
MKGMNRFEMFLFVGALALYAFAIGGYIGMIVKAAFGTTDSMVFRVAVVILVALVVIVVSCTFAYMTKTAIELGRRLEQ